MRSIGISKFLTLSTEAKVIYYKNNFGQFIQKKETKSYYTALFESILSDAYLIPVEKNIIHIEEASGFVIYLTPYIRVMVDEFKNEEGKWESYFIKYTKNRYINYKRKQDKLAKLEKYLLKAVTITSYNNFGSSCAEKTAVEEQPLKVKKILYIFHTSPVARENFFLYLMAYAACFTDEMIETICKTFSIDKAQTFKLLRKADIQAERERIELKRESLMLRSNYNLSHILFAEFEIDNARRTKNTEEEKKQLEIRSNNLRRQSERLDQIARLQPRARELAVSETLSIKRGTLSSKIFYARQLLKWAASSDTTYFPEFIKKKTVENFIDGSWEKELKTMYPLKLFKPAEVFRDVLNPPFIADLLQIENTSNKC